MALNKLNLFKFINANHSKLLYSTNATIGTSDALIKLPTDKAATSNTKSQRLSRAMIAFLERYNAHESIINRKEAEFQIGKRYLAKIMGINEDENFDQASIDKAISYLLPSGLTNPKARPFMKSPKEYYPKAPETRFDKDGRPYHYLFYTLKPNYYELLDNIANKHKHLNELQDALFFMKKEAPTLHKLEKDTHIKYDTKGSEWIKPNEFAEILGEKLSDEDYIKFIASMEYLMSHEFSNKEEEFISKYRKKFSMDNLLENKKELLTDENGIKYQIASTTQRTANINVRLSEGTGEIRIKAPEGSFDINYFHELKHKEQLLFPFKIVNAINKFDIDIEVNDGGMSCIAKGARFAITQALISFLSYDDIEKLRLAGLLTYDKRLKERKKYGQEGARRKFTWKKR